MFSKALIYMSDRFRPASLKQRDACVGATRIVSNPLETFA
jgi:hypothetical protein